MNIFKKVEELEDIVDRLLKVDSSPDAMRYALFASGIVSKVKVWKDNGAKTFILTRDLIEAFKYTDVPVDVYPTEFHYPFHTFMLESDAGPLFTTKTPEGEREIHCILYVSDTVVYKSGTPLFKQNGSQTDKLEWTKGLTGFYTNALGSLEYLKLHMKDDCTIKQALDVKSPDTLLAADDDDTKNLVNLFFNAIMYINDPERSKVETESPGTRKFKINGKETVRSNYILLKAPKDYVSLSKSAKSGILDKRFIVRGHWRNQAYGEKFSLKKRIWIQPYYKGPDFAPIESKPYKVE